MEKVVVVVEIEVWDLEPAVLPFPDEYYHL